MLVEGLVVAAGGGLGGRRARGMRAATEIPAPLLHLHGQRGVPLKPTRARDEGGGGAPYSSPPRAAGRLGGTRAAADLPAPRRRGRGVLRVWRARDEGGAPWGAGEALHFSIASTFGHARSPRRGQCKRSPWFSSAIARARANPTPTLARPACSLHRRCPRQPTR